jgi:hypothetical protein
VLEGGSGRNNGVPTKKVSFILAIAVVVVLVADRGATREAL